MTRALVVGEALIDIVRRGGEVTEHVGGSPLNVAVGIARLGHGVDFLTHIGDDPRGRRVAAHLDAAGVALVEGSADAPRTPTARATLDADGAATYQFDISWALRDTAPARPPVVVHTGSIAAVLEPGCQAVEAVLDRCRAAATLTFDPNVRSALIEDAVAARRRIERFVAGCDVVKASDEDLRWIEPDAAPETVARAWHAAGPAIVAVTRGARGAVAVCAAGTVEVPARAVEVVDTVGAGDAFTAGLIDALWTRDLVGAGRRDALARISLDELRAVLDTAACGSALTVARAGADLPDRATRDAAASHRR